MWRFLSFRQLRISVTIAEIICLAKSNHVIVLASKISDSAFLRSNYDSEVTESMTFPNGTAYNVFVPSQKVRETVGSVRAKNPFESSSSAGFLHTHGPVVQAEYYPSVLPSFLLLVRLHPSYSHLGPLVRPFCTIAKSDPRQLAWCQLYLERYTRIFQKQKRTDASCFACPRRSCS